MFQTKKYITDRQGQSSPNRFQYLQQLVQEYSTTDSLEAKQQVLANLANFSYDPVNYNWLWEINVVDLFIYALYQEDKLLQEFGMGGLANICLEPRHQHYIASDPKHIDVITSYIRTKRTNITTNTILNALVTLMLLLDSQNQSSILTNDLKDGITRLQADSTNPAISTMATLFLQDYYLQ
ncbi:hypothetical protein BCR42DRAFT_429903 [Absidia repens]|uniref:Armadillo-type protein n=1 Tax=Absidia repens TaxID=90262 RepID=A0A1X2HMG1_9FUNG|nr:hypothetical protein BCR42DRAFT_429903 [Absidia repens]